MLGIARLGVLICAATSASIIAAGYRRESSPDTHLLRLRTPSLYVGSKGRTGPVLLLCLSSGRWIKLNAEFPARRLIRHSGEAFPPPLLSASHSCREQRVFDQVIPLAGSDPPSCLPPLRHCLHPQRGPALSSDTLQRAVAPSSARPGSARMDQSVTLPVGGLAVLILLAPARRLWLHRRSCRFVCSYLDSRPKSTVRASRICEYRDCPQRHRSG